MEEAHDPRLAEILSALPRFYLVARKALGSGTTDSGYQLAAVAAAEWLGNVARCPSGLDWPVVLTLAHMMGPAYEDLQSMVDYEEMPPGELELGLLRLLRDEFDYYLARVGWYLPRDDMVKGCLDEVIRLYQTSRNTQVSTTPMMIPASPMAT